MARIRLKCILLIATILVIIGCRTDLKKDNVEIDPEAIQWQNIATKLLALSDLEKEEKVLLMAAPGLANDIVEQLTSKLEESDAIFMGTLSITNNQPKAWSSEFVEACQNKTKEELQQIFQEVDLGIMLPGASSAHIPYQALQSILQKGIRRTIHFHWTGAYDLNGTEIIVNKQRGKFYEHVILSTDYRALSQKQADFEIAMRGQIIRVTTSQGTDISFEIGDRPVTKQDGNATAERARSGRNLIDREIEIPAGVIRVAPIEESVNGKIAFPNAKWNGKDVKSLVMYFENGKVSSYEAESGEESVKAELDKAGESARSFREFALGFNPLMPVQRDSTSWIPYYGYGAGVVRLSLGDNTELGGKVQGGYVRWNFFVDATVTAGDEIWVENGTLVK